MAVSWREIHMVSYLAVPPGIYLAFHIGIDFFRLGLHDT